MSLAQLSRNVRLYPTTIRHTRIYFVHRACAARYRSVYLNNNDYDAIRFTADERQFTRLIIVVASGRNVYIDRRNKYEYPPTIPSGD